MFAHANLMTAWSVGRMQWLGGTFHYLNIRSRLCRKDDSEPIICNTSTISWQVVSGLEPVVTDDRNLLHILGVG